MELRHYMTCLWPGMPELWWQGQLSALPVAIGAGLWLNLLLVTRYIYPQWVSGMLVTMAIWISFALWGFFVFHRIRDLPTLLQPRTNSDVPDLFPEARDNYLSGKWSEAEKLLLRVLAIQPKDPPALLLLSGVYRHTARPDNAKCLMKELSRLEIADGWWLEIEAELKRIERLTEAEDGQDEDSEAGTQSSADLTAA